MADYSHGPRQATYDLYTMEIAYDADHFRGGAVTRITDKKGTDILPVFSPDGKKLMWTSTAHTGWKQPALDRGLASHDAVALATQLKAAASEPTAGRIGPFPIVPRGQKGSPPPARRIAPLDGRLISPLRFRGPWHVMPREQR